MSGCVCVSYLGKRWQPDALWEEVKPGVGYSFGVLKVLKDLKFVKKFKQVQTNGNCNS